MPEVVSVAQLKLYLRLQGAHAGLHSLGAELVPQEAICGCNSLQPLSAEVHFCNFT